MCVEVEPVDAVTISTASSVSPRNRVEHSEEQRHFDRYKTRNGLVNMETSYSRTVTQVSNCICMLHLYWINAKQNHGLSL